MGFKASCPQYISNMQGDWVLAAPRAKSCEPKKEKKRHSAWRKQPDCLIKQPFWLFVENFRAQVVPNILQPMHEYIQAVDSSRRSLLKYVPGAFLCSICDAEQKKKKTSPYMRQNYVNVNYSCLIHFAVNYCWSCKSVKRCKKKKKIDWEYDAECHFNATQQAKQSERSIREIIENRWSIWPTGRLKQASLKVKNFVQVRARHAQSKRWVKASKHPSL